MANEKTTTGATDWEPPTDPYHRNRDLLMIIRESAERIRAGETQGALTHLECAETIAAMLPQDSGGDSEVLLDTDGASLNLCYASAMLHVMIGRFERYSQEIARILGGRNHTDVDMLHAILEKVRQAKEVVDGN